MPKQKLYEQGSLMHYAVIGFSNIKKLSESSLISEKLLGLSSVMFVLIMAANITGWLNTFELFSFSGIVIFLLSVGFAFAISVLYSPLLNLIANFSANKIESVRIGLIVLFAGLPVAVIGLLYKLALLTKISMILIGLQLVIILLGSIVRYAKAPVQDVNVATADLWKVIGRVSNICGILSFMITLVTLIVKYL
jgi:hypothetical protein